MKVWIFKWGKKGKVPTLNDLDHETLVKDKATGNLYGIKESDAGVKQRVQYTAYEVGSTPDHGVSSFLELTDTPDSYEGNAGKVPRVNSAEDALEWVNMTLELDAETLTFDGIKTTLTAGEALTAGNLCYMTGGKMYKADADAVATSFCFAIATDAIDADSQGVFLLIGIISGFSSLTVGAPVFLSTTSGGLTQTLPSGSNDVVQVVGIALSATHVYFKPDLVQIELL